MQEFYGIEEVGEEIFRLKLREVNYPTLFIFKTEWSASAEILCDIIGRLAGSYYDRMAFFKVDADACPDLIAELGIREFPTVLVVQRGEVIDHFTGVLNTAKICSRLDRLLAA